MTKHIYSVGQVNTYIKNMFAQDFMMNRIYVRGEVSNCKYHTSGHIYFTLKDASGAMKAIMFAGSRKKGLSFPMKDGDNVVVLGAIRVYERDGQYQLYAQEIILEGAGLLYQRYEQLKKELEEMGMFAEEYKHPIPKYPGVIGVVTASTGAAIRDIQNIAARRNPYVQLILYPARVQGEGAAESIVKGIYALEQYGVDVIIVGRGGGSIEDLWAFNEEIVARAIFECQIPVISAVGHETDTTIADYVADRRAPTPSAAAELAVYDIRSVFDDLETKRLRLGRGLVQRIHQTKERLKQYQIKLKWYDPMHQLQEKRQRSADLWERLERAMEQILRDKRHEIEMYAARLDSISPLKKISGGCGLVTDERGYLISSIGAMQPGETVEIHMEDGTARAQIRERILNDE